MDPLSSVEPAAADWIDQVGRLRRWRDAGTGERAPHKPLLLLYALGRYQRDPEASLGFAEVEDELKALILEFSNARPTPHYPFHRLVRDGVWEVRTADGGPSPGDSAALLRTTAAQGRLAAGLRRALAADGTLLGRLVQAVLDQHFAPTLHDDLLEATGLAFEAAPTHAPGLRQLRRGAAEFRAAVLDAYDGSCAFCGYDGRLDQRAVAVEAAHIRWWAFGGPDRVENAFSLCTLHHRLYDRGVLTVDTDRVIRVSPRFTARSATARAQVGALAGRSPGAPRHGTPAPAHLGWHEANVFRG